ncbi:MAG TPA: hypothetical protein VIL69_04845 [Roseomonas sp.]|jgi:hypothetical protein
MTTIASESSATLRHGLGRSLTIATLAAGLIGAAVGPTLAEGNYVTGPSASPAWTQSASRTPLAASAPTPASLLLGGDDQYVVGVPAFQAWPKTEGRTPLAAPGTTMMNFDLASQGN